MTTATEAQNRVLELYQSNRLLRNKWSGTTDDGREMLCFLTALSGDSDDRPGSCKALPEYSRWLLHLLPWFDDAPSDSAWPSIIERCIALIPTWFSWTAEESKRMELRVKRVSVEHARPHDRGSCERVLTLIDRELAGDPPSENEWRADAAADAADAAAAAAAYADAAAAAYAYVAAAADADAAAYAYAAAAAAAADDSDDLISKILAIME